MTRIHEHLVPPSGRVPLPVNAESKLLSDLLSRDEHARAVAELATDPDLGTM